MPELNKKEIIIRNGTIGFVLGIISSLLIYLMIFGALEQTLSLSQIGHQHSQLWYLYLIDFLPIPGLLGGMLVGRYSFRQIDMLYARLRRETDKNAEIKQFAHSLIAGDLNTSITLPQKDRTLSDSLNKLKDTLVRNREIERQRRLDEQQRNWISEGLAEFGDILRTHAQELESMAYAVISNLVRYLDANQGALYLTEREGKDRILTMLACHAYERKKFPDQKISWGEGLIGAVAMEKKGFYTDKIPDGYLTITSGLGKANPKYLLIEPLIWNDRVFGIIEIASFKALEDYKLQFVSRVAESIATTVNTMESTLRTEQLLKETQAQADQLA